MSPNPRQLTLLTVVQAQGSVTVEQLAATLGVTLQTVRRDVQRLADATMHALVELQRSLTQRPATAGKKASKVGKPAATKRRQGPARAAKASTATPSAR